MSLPLDLLLLKTKKDSLSFSSLEISSEYQAIVSLSTGDILGYEALGRFKGLDGGVTPEKIFHSSLFSDRYVAFLDILLNAQQIENRPSSGILFLNVSASLMRDVALHNAWLDKMRGIGDYVVELPECCDSTSLSGITTFSSLLSSANIPFAIDGILSDGNIFCSNLLSASPIIKIDKAFLVRIRTMPSYIHFAKGLISFCNELGKTTIIEGIESASDLEVAKEIGATHVQGFYFKSHTINTAFEPLDKYKKLW